MTVIGALLPEWVAAREAYEDSGGSSLYPEEEAAVAQAVPKRQREFATVRACARGALAQLGCPPVPLLPGKRGAPGWPEGVVGSMTHCDGYRAAAVARRGDAASLGIDAEPDEPLPEGVLEVIALPSERRWAGAPASGGPQVCRDRLLFSAKESVFKTWYPLTGRELGFEEAEIELGASAGTFTARLLVEGPVVGDRRVDGFTGSWLVRNGLIVTTIVQPAAGGGQFRHAESKDHELDHGLWAQAQGH
jgi:enterobactin synthetase component D / holo-[acyl-carrier protein] synthase